MADPTQPVEDQVRGIEDRPDGEAAKQLDAYPDDHGDPDEPAAAAPSGPPATQWRVAKSLLRLREQVNANFPGRSTDSDGTIGDLHHCPGSSDHCPKHR